MINTFSPKAFAIFDFDKTISSNDTLFDFLFYISTKKIHRFLFSVTISFAFLPLIIVNINAYISIVLWAGTFLINDDTLDGIVESFAKKQFVSVYRDAMDEIIRLQKLNYTIVIVSGSSPLWISKIMAMHQLTGIHILGSSFKSFFGGKVMVLRCVSEMKVKAISERFGNDELVDWERCYSDSLVDLPIFKMAKLRFLINPSLKRIEQATCHFQNNYEVCRWK